MSEAVYISRGGQTDYLVGLKDLYSGLKRTELWRAFAFDEIQQRYRRSRLGLAWVVVSYLIFVCAIAIFFGGFSSKQEMDFLAHVAVSYAIFSFLIGNLSDGCVVFSGNKLWIASVPLPNSVYVLKSVARSLFVFAITIVPALGIVFWAGHLTGAITLLAVPALLVLIVNGVLIQTTLGYINVRYRDIEHLIASMTRVLFFVTPILWVRTDMPPGTLRRWIADLNPFTHALEVFTAPLLGRVPDPLSWQVVGAITAINFIVMLVVSYIAYRRMPYWL